MKITRNQLRRIIKEERQKLLREQWGNQESMLSLVTFAQQWASLGGAVQEQIVTVANGFVENDQEAVYDINPNALDLALERLENPLNILSPDHPEAEELYAALQWAKDIFLQGEAEVEADARAAGDL